MTTSNQLQEPAALEPHPADVGGVDKAVRPKPLAPHRRKPRKRGRWVVFAVLAILIGVGAYWALHRQAQTVAAVVDPADLVEVRRGSVEKSVDSSCKVVANLDVDIKCRASGEVIKLPFDISQKVKKGDLLCELDSTDEKLSVRSAEVAVAQSTAKLTQSQFNLDEARLNLVTTRSKYEAALASAKVKATNLRLKVERQKKLVSKQLVSQEDLETSQTEAALAEAEMHSAEVAVEELKQQEIRLKFKEQDVKTAEAQLRADNILLEIQKQQLAYTIVNAPLDGTVSAMNVQKGTMVASGTNAVNGGTTIITLSDLSRVFVIATVDESDIGDVRVGQKARITVASYPGRIFAGQVVRKATKGVNASNVVTFEVKVEVLDDQKELLQPEMTGNVTIIQDQRTDVLTVSASAINRDGGQTFMMTPDHQQRPVKVGLQGAEVVEIVSGASAGERFIMATAELPTRWKSQERGPGGGPPPQ